MSLIDWDSSREEIKWTIECAFGILLYYYVFDIVNKIRKKVY